MAVVILLSLGASVTLGYQLTGKLVGVYVSALVPADGSVLFGQPSVSGQMETEEELSDADMIYLPRVRTQARLASGEAALEQGAWLRSQTRPGQIGNTVVVGHRFSLIEGKRAFFALDELRPGDEIVVRWRGEIYLYLVDKAFVVADTAMEIEIEQAAASRLTLYTCDLVRTDRRLVITAELAPAT